MPLSDDEFHSRFPRLRLKDYVALARAPRLQPEKQWWNLPAKYQAVDRIAEEEGPRSILLARQAGLKGARNNIYDAERHARWSGRMAREVDPITAVVAGYGHEAKNLIEGAWRAGYYYATRGAHEARYRAEGRPTPRMAQVWDEIQRDSRNNATGRATANSGRPIPRGSLQTLPGATRN